MARPTRKTVFTTEKIEQTGGLVSKPNILETMWTNTQYTLIPKVAAQPELSTVKVSPTQATVNQYGNNVKTTWAASEQEITILTAMEKQKQAEQDGTLGSSKPEMLILDKATDQLVPLSSNPRLQAQIEAQKIRRAEQDQMALDFKNRTHEEKLRNFIETQLEAERKEDTGTNFTQYVSELGDQKLNEMNVNPQVIFQAQPLTNPADLAAAGVSPRIIDKMLESGIDRDSTPTETVTVSNTNPPSTDTHVNFTGLSDDPIFYSGYQDHLALYQGNSNVVFNPIEEQNQNNVVTNQAVSQVNYEGSGSSTHQPIHTSTHEVVITEKAGLAKIWHENPALVSAVGIGIMVLGS